MKEIRHRDEFSEADGDDNLPEGSEAHGVAHRDRNLAWLAVRLRSAVRARDGEVGVAVWPRTEVFGSASQNEHNGCTDDPESDADAEKHGSPSDGFDQPDEEGKRDGAHGGKGHDGCECARPEADEPVDDRGDEDNEFAERHAESQQQHRGVEVPKCLHLAQQNEAASGEEEAEDQNWSWPEAVYRGADEWREE